jgi:hypothetical protein
MRLQHLTSWLFPQLQLHLSMPAIDPAHEWTLSENMQCVLVVSCQCIRPHTKEEPQYQHRKPGHSQLPQTELFNLLIGCGTKYRTRLIMTSPACQVHRRPTHLEPALHNSTIMPTHNCSYYRPPPAFPFPSSVLKNGSWSNLTSKSPGLMLRRSGHQLRGLGKSPNVPFTGLNFQEKREWW